MANMMGKILNCERYAGVTAVLFALIWMVMPLGVFILLPFMTVIALRQSVRFSLVVLIFAAIPAIAFVFLQKLGMPEVVLVMTALTWLVGVWLRYTKVSYSVVLYVLAAVALLLLLAVDPFEASIAAMWKHMLLTQLRESGLQFPEHMIDLVTKPAYFRGIMSGRVFMSMSCVIFSIGMGVAWHARALADMSFFDRLKGVSVSGFYVVVPLLYWLACEVLHLRLAAYGLVLVLPLLFAGVSLLMFKGWLKNLISSVVVCLLVGMVLAVVWTPWCFMAAVALFFIVVFGVTVLGLIDSWVDFRSRKAFSSSAQSVDVVTDN